jgi:hypothetical protein
MVVLPLIYFQSKQSKKDVWVMLSSLCFILMLVSVILTFSRNAFVNMIIFFILINIRKKISIKIWSLALLIILLIIITPSTYWSRISTITSYESGSALKLKLDYFISGIKIVSNQPIFGAGYGNVFTIHNSMLQIAAELGLVVLILYLSIIFIFLKDMKKIGSILQKRSHGDITILPWILSICIIAYIVGGLSISIPLFHAFFIILAVGMVLKRLTLSESFYLNQTN